MQKHSANNLEFYQSDLLEGTRHGIFTRHGGVSDAPFGALNVGGTVGDDVTNVHANHRLMYDVLDVNAEQACTTWQVHGADVVVSNGPVANRKWVARADSIITDREHVPLVMRFADCVPLIMYDPAHHAIGLAHAGWRGTVRGVGKETVRAMQDAYGSQPEDIRVVVGPSISIDKFQVGEEVVEAFETYFGATDGLMRRDPADGTAYMDLWEANRRDLVSIGVEQIEIMGICTASNTDDFFSHRQEKGKTGRFGVVIEL
ncbi:MAG: peptidoglycan editing factor PgeF [Chloroflexota bacterium]